MTDRSSAPSVSSPAILLSRISAVLCMCAMLGVPLLAGTRTVTTTIDTVPTPTTNSLRWAIQEANSGACTSPCTITFSGAGIGTHSINSTTQLDMITASSVTIDGYANGAGAANTNAFPGALNATLGVIVRGGGASPSTPGLWARGTDVTIQGLVLQNFTTAIYIDRFATATKIYGNYIGTNAAGTAAAPNSAGVAISSQTQTGAAVSIGGATAAQRNLISGNTADGISLGPTVSVGTTIDGNFIGVNAAGTGDLGNGGNGIRFQSAVTTSTVGSAVGNVISGNNSNGIYITSTGNGHSITLNRIGTNAAGTGAIANSASGILIDGGPLSTDITNNTISGNGTYGVSITTGSNISINGNRIGANASGTAAIPNTSGGVRIDAGTNLLVGNSSGNTILGSGAGYGVFLAGGNQHRILNNTIRSLAKGIVVGSASVPNMIENNAISLNGIGIDLSDNGVTTNDATDSDTGGNNLQNYPTITSAVWRPGLPTTVNMTINSSAGNGSSLFLELFRADASANAQGLQRLVTQCVAAKTFTGSMSVPAGVLALNEKVVAAAAAYADSTCSGSLNPTTSADGGSEFSPAATVVSQPGDVNLSITKTDGLASIAAGSALTYTIVVTNNGPSATTGSTLTDNFVATLTGISWSCSASAGGSCGTPTGTGNITARSFNLPVGGTATFTVNATLSPTATGTLVNTATCAVGPGETDTITGNNSATDIDSITQQTDLAVSKTDGVTSVTTGSPVTYTVVANNNGPSTATGATVSDVIPASLLGVSWICTPSAGATCTANGSGNVADTVTLPPGATATYTISGTLSTSASGTLTNTASSAPGGGANDPNAANNSATDIDTIVVSADLVITKTDGVTQVNPGSGVTYTIVATNNGPADVTAAPVTDSFPAELTGVTWSCTATAGSSCGAPSGSGNINTTVTLLSGGTATFTASGTLSPTATGSLSNTATVAPPAGASDPTPANNSATDTDTIVVTSDLAITKDDGLSTVNAGTGVGYTVVVTNNGPADVTAISVTDALPSTITGVSWTCLASPGSSCSVPSGSGDIATTVNLLSGGSAMFSVAGTLVQWATGSVSNTATVAMPAGGIDSNPANNSATDTNTIVVATDLAITKTDGVTSVNAGAAVNYTIVVSNLGPADIVSAPVTDTFAAALTGMTWSCSATAGSACGTASGAGNIATTVSLLVNGSATFTASGTLSAGATGTLSNSATVAAPAGATETNLSNNTATDADTVAVMTDLAITKTDGASTVNAGDSVTYTIVVTNNGPSDATGAQITDTFQAVLSGLSWTCSASPGSTCAAPSGTGNVATTLNLLSGGSATISATGTVSPTATGTLTNSATVAAGAGATDPVTANDSATDSDTIAIAAALSIQITDNTTTVTAGTAVTYTITAANGGPSSVTGATVVNTLPATLTGATWTCTATVGSTCPPSGSGSINATIDLAPGGSAVFTLTATVAATATGTFASTATITPPAGVTEFPSDNSATDTDTIQIESDVSVTKSDGVTSVVAGTPVSYTIVVSNAGPSAVNGVSVTDTLPATLTGSTWTCTPTAGSSCGVAAGSGSIATTANLLVGGSATYTVAATVSPAATGTLTNAVTANVPAGVTDPSPGNNSATDIDTLTAEADLGLTRSTFGPVVAGTTLTYTITVSNTGPSSVTGATLTDVLAIVPIVPIAPAQKRGTAPNLAGATWSCTATAGSTCAAASGSGDVTVTLNLAAGGSATINVSAPIPAAATGMVTNTTTLTLPAGVTDPTPTNNTSSVSAPITLQSDLSIVKTNNASTVNPLEFATYAITVSNPGPSVAFGVVVKDLLPSYLSGATWTCIASAGSSCAAASGAGDINTTVNLAVGGSATFSLKTMVDLTSGTVTNTASLTPPVTVTDTNLANNSSTDTDSVVACPAGPAPLSGVINEAVTEIVVSWTDVASPLYEVMVSINGGPITSAGTTAGTQMTVSLPLGATQITWYVVAIRGNCTLAGASSTVYVDPDTCLAPDIPLAAVVGSVNSGQQYTFFWFTENVDVRFEYAESNGPDMTGVLWIPTTLRTATFTHENPASLAQQYCYAVRAFRDCPRGTKQSDISKSVCVSVLPATTPDGNVVVEDGDTDLVTQIVRLCSDEQQHVYDCSNPEYSKSAVIAPHSGPTVTLGSDRTWMSVTPTTTTVPQTGTNVTVTSAPLGLPTGTNTGSIVVTSTSTGQASNVPFSVNIVTPVSPQGKTGPPANALIIPAVAHVAGVDSRWQSDIRMTNTSLTKIAYDLTFTPSGENGSSVGKKTRIELSSGETKALDDIVKHWYGLGTLQNGSNGVLEIRPVEFNGKTADATFGFATVASSRTYNNTEKGTYGQWIPAVPFANFIGRGEDGISPILSMQQIAQSQRYRTNLGVVEGAGLPVTVQFTVFNAAGTKITEFAVELKAMEHQQLNSILATKNITLEDGRIEAKVIAGDGRITTYASVVDAGTDDPLLVPGEIALNRRAGRFVLPGIADIDTGRNHWRSDTRIFNPGESAVEATVIFYAQNEPSNTKSTQITIEPGQVRVINDTLRTLFASENVGGAIHIVTPADTALVATSRTYDQQTEGTFGQFIPAVTADDAVSAADRALEILQVEQSDRYRTNLGLAEVTGHAVTIEITALVPESTVALKLRRVLQPYEFTQLNGVLQQMNLGTVYNGRLSVKVVEGEGRVAAYGSIIDQQTQDPTYVPAQ